MGTFINRGDLTVFAPDMPEDVADALIEDAEAEAMLAAPCLEDIDELTDLQLDQVKAILRGAILRKHEAGAGGSTQLSAGPFSQTVTTAATRALFFRSELRKLRGICKSGGAFMVDLMPRRDS